MKSKENLTTRNFGVTLVALLLAVFTSCSQIEETQVEIYPEKEVTLNTKRVITQSETAFARMNNVEFLDYTHNFPTEFNVYFIASTGSDQNTVIKKFKSMTAGSHRIVVPARPYRVVITNYNLDEKEKRRNLLPEYSWELYLYGEATIDFKALDEGEVTVTNDYAASMIKKSDMIESAPAINQAAYFVTPDYYVLYLRDQGGATTFTRNTQLYLFNMYGLKQHYNLSHTYTANKVSRFHFNLFSETDGNLNIVVDENILKQIEDKVVVPD